MINEGEAFAQLLYLCTYAVKKRGGSQIIRDFLDPLMRDYEYLGDRISSQTAIERYFN